LDFRIALLYAILDPLKSDVNPIKPLNAFAPNAQVNSHGHSWRVGSLYAGGRGREFFGGGTPSQPCAVLHRARPGPDRSQAWGAPHVPEDLLEHDCIGFNFKRAAPTWPFRKDGHDYSLIIKGSVETNNGDTQGQLAAEGIGIARVCAQTVKDAIQAGRLVPLLEEFNPGDGEEIHAVFLGGPHTPARVRCFIDYLVECFQ
jgi:DNA-binding transcriptional LysR family regulator